MKKVFTNLLLYTRIELDYSLPLSGKDFMYSSLLVASGRELISSWTRAD